MSALKTLYRHSSHYLGGRVAVMLLGFASFPIFTRLFSVVDYGTINLISSTILLLTVLSKFGFQNSVQRYYPEHASSPDPNAVRRYYSTLFYGTAAIGFLLIVIFMFLVAAGFGHFLGITATAPLLLACVLVMVRALRSMQMNLMQMENKTGLFNGMDIVQKAASVIAICLLLFFWQKSVLAFFVGLAVVEAGILLQYIPVLARRGLVSPTMFNPGFFHQAVVFSFPLMAAEISWVALGSADRFFVEHYLGGQALGYYAAAYGIANYFQDLLMAPLQLALFPICMNLWVAKGKEETQKFLNRSLDHFVMAAVGVVCIAIVTSRDVILVLASRKFQEAHSLLPYLVIGLVLSAATIYFRPGLMIHQKASKIAMATLYATLMNIGLNSILLPRIGLIGAAVATVLSYAAMVVFLAYESLRVLPFRIEWKAFLRYGTSGIAVGWLALQIRIANPLVSSILRTTLIVTLYLGILWLADAQVRALLAKGYSLGIKWLKAHRRGAPIHQRETILSREPGIQNLG